MSTDNSNISNNSNSVMVNPTEGEVAFRETPYRGGYSGETQPAVNVVHSSGMTPQVLILLLTCAIKRCWKWAFFLGLILASLGATATWMFYPVKYEATAWIFAYSQVPYTVFQTPEGRGDYANFLATQFARIRSPQLLAEALTDPQLSQVQELHKQKDQIKWLQKNIVVKQQGQSEYFTISYSDARPADALAVATAVTDAYLKRYANETNKRDVQLTTDLLLEKNQYENAVRLQRQALTRLMKEAASKRSEFSSLPGGAAQMQSIRKDYILEEAKLQAMLARYEAAKGFNPENREIPQLVLDNAIRNDPAMLYQQSFIDTLTAKIEARTKTVNPNDDILQNMQVQLREAKEELVALERTLRTTKQRELQENLKMKAQDNLWTFEAEIESQKALVAILAEKMSQETVEVQEGTEEAATIRFLEEEMVRDTQILNKLAERIAVIQAENRSPARVIPDQAPTLPTMPNTENLLPITILVGIGLFGVPFVLGIALEMMKPRLYHVSQVRKAIPEVLIGEIMEPPVAWLHGNTFRKRLARYRETVHNWCTHLLLADPFRHYQTMAVASVAGDDGKTFLAIQIATAMAQMKSGPILLIDGDMRVGRLHLLFGNEESGPGLADVLSFRKGIGEAIVMNEREPNLHLLSAGNLDISPYELLGDGRFRELLDTLSTHYSMILVVVPPITNAAESLIMASSVESVVLCVRQGETVLAAMEDAFRKLVDTGSHVDGIVVKDIPYSHMAGKDGGFSDKIEQIRLAHLLKQSDAY